MDPDPSGPRRPGRLRTGADYPAALRATELPAPDLARVVSDQGRLRALAKVLADPKGTERSVTEAMARALSSGWRGNAPGARSYGRGVAGYLSASIGSVRLVPKSMVTVAGDSVTIPVTVDNGLQQDLTGVELRVVSSIPERLRPVRGTVAVQVAGAVSRTVRVRLSAQANGPVRLTARLHITSDGQPWGDPITFTADVRSVSSGAIALVGGGGLLIVLAATLRLRRTRARATGTPHGR
jgi:hypothetical protein